MKYLRLIFLNVHLLIFESYIFTVSLVPDQIIGFYIIKICCKTFICTWFSYISLTVLRSKGKMKALCTF